MLTDCGRRSARLRVDGRPFPPGVFTTVVSSTIETTGFVSVEFVASACPFASPLQQDFPASLPLQHAAFPSVVQAFFSVVGTAVVLVVVVWANAKVKESANAAINVPKIFIIERIEI